MRCNLPGISQLFRVELGFSWCDGRSHAPNHHAAVPGDHRKGAGAPSPSQVNQYHLRGHGVNLKGPE